MNRVLQGRSASGAQHAFARLTCCLRALFRSAVQPLRRRAAIAELQRLNPRALRDAGIEPDGIERMIDDMLASQRRDE